MATYIQPVPRNAQVEEHLRFLEELRTKTNTLVGQGASISVTQVAHGLAVQEAVYFDGTDWQKAKANAIATIGTGVIQSVTGADKFVVVRNGKITGLSGLTTGNWYYTSDATSGLLTLTESAIYSNPLLIATSATTGIVVPLRAQDIGGSAGRVTRADYDSSSPEYLYTGTADPGTATSSSLWRISRYDFTDGSVTYADSDQLYDNVYDNRESLSYS